MFSHNPPVVYHKKFERRNKESKAEYKRHCNNKGNICKQTMKGLTANYYYGFQQNI